MAALVKHYSLIDYSITISCAVEGLAVTLKEPVKLGGAQSYLSRVSVASDTENITKTADATGSVVYGFSNDHSGTVSVELSFVSEALDRLLELVRSKYLDDPTKWYEARFNIDIYRIGYSNLSLVSCSDCMLKSPRANWEIATEVGTRSYEFFAARVQERTLEQVMLAAQG